MPMLCVFRCVIHSSVQDVSPYSDVCMSEIQKQWTFENSFQYKVIFLNDIYVSRNKYFAFFPYRVIRIVSKLQGKAGITKNKTLWYKLLIYSQSWINFQCLCHACHIVLSKIKIWSIVKWKSVWYVQVNTKYHATIQHDWTTGTIRKSARWAHFLWSLMIWIM